MIHADATLNASADWDRQGIVLKMMHMLETGEISLMYDDLDLSIAPPLPPPAAADNSAMRWLREALRGTGWVNWLHLRQAYISRYGWALASGALLDRLVSEMAGARVLSVCAGKAYIEWELQKRGVSVKPVDYDMGMGETARRELQARAYAEVDYGGALNAVSAEPEADLLAIWPPGEGEWQERMLRLSNCRRVYYVGEPAGDSTGSDGFHDALDDLFAEVEEVKIPAWVCINDRLVIYERKGRKGLTLTLMR